MRFSTSASSMRSSAIRELMSLASKPDIISFSGGMPNNDLLPVQEIDEIYNSLSPAVKKQALQYGPTGGYPPFLESLKAFLKEKGLPVEDNGLIVTTGSMQAISILSKIFIDPGDRVITEYPAFIGAISAFKSFQADFETISLDDDGANIQELENILNSSKPLPKFVYITPYFHNPAGILYSKQRRQELMQTLKGHDIIVIEDDAYGELYFDEKDKELTVPIKATGPETVPICYTSSFSKYIGPGLRIGWLLAPNEIIEKCDLAKQSLDACTSTLSQVLAHEFLVQNRLPDYLERLRRAYKKRSELMLDALDAVMPEGVTWTHPKGGFYIWVTLPEQLNAMEILKKTIDKGAVFVVGNTFDPLGERNNCMRISFCNTPEDKIAHGVELVAESIKSFL